jgi:hypothetical protein
MRALLVGLFALLAACASTSTPDDEPSPSPFPVARGTAAPPPASAASGRTAPPEGRAAGGIDFGQWRSADPATYQPRLESQIRARLAGLAPTAVRPDLEGNGFACEDNATGLDCRIEIMERQCAYDWYVVVDRTRDAPVVGFDIMCLGANSGAR